MDIPDTFSHLLGVGAALVCTCPWLVLGIGPDQTTQPRPIILQAKRARAKKDKKTLGLCQ
jgi:hypothetical protein